MLPSGKTIYVNCGETTTLLFKIMEKNNDDVLVASNLTGKEIRFYLKLREQDKDSDAFIVKSSNNLGEITITNAINGEGEIEISSSDTISLEEKNLTKQYKYSLRLIYGNITRHISEGYLVVTPR